MEQLDGLREFIQELRHELFKEYHEDAVRDGAKNPLTAVEKRWSEFLKTTSY